MADCRHECFRVVTQIASYTYDPSAIKWKSSSVVGWCPRLSDQEIADEVAKWVSLFRVSVQEPSCCDKGCICVPYDKPQRPRELKPRNVDLCIDFSRVFSRTNMCIYTICITAQIRETVTPIGLCRPVKLPMPSYVPTPEPPPLPPAPPKTKTVTVGGIAPVDADSKTKKKKKPGSR